MPLEALPLTPGEAVKVAKRIREDREREMRLAVVTGWNAERFARTKRLPSLKALFAKQPKKPTEEELVKRRAEMDEMMARMGKGVEVLR